MLIVSYVDLHRRSRDKTDWSLQDSKRRACSDSSGFDCKVESEPSVSRLSCSKSNIQMKKCSVFCRSDLQNMTSSLL
jgi:hypothetical protein